MQEAYSQEPSSAPAGSKPSFQADECALGEINLMLFPRGFAFVGHWAKIASELPHRSGSQCLSKWKVMAGVRHLFALGAFLKVRQKAPSPGIPWGRGGAFRFWPWHCPLEARGRGRPNLVSSGHVPLEVFLFGGLSFTPG